MSVLQPVPSAMTADSAAMSSPHRTLSGPNTAAAAAGHDSSSDDDDKFYEDGEEIYAKFSSSRKRTIVAVLGFGAFVALVSSTSVLPAVPEITATFGSKDTVVEISNAIYIALTGVGCVVWGPMSQIYGRRVVSAILSVEPSYFGGRLGDTRAPELTLLFYRLYNAPVHSSAS